MLKSPKNKSLCESCKYGHCIVETITQILPTPLDIPEEEQFLEEEEEETEMITDLREISFDRHSSICYYNQNSYPLRFGEIRECNKYEKS